MLFVVLCNCWLRLCCMLYWFPVLHNTCYAHWSGWKCRGGAGGMQCMFAVMVVCV